MYLQRKAVAPLRELFSTRPVVLVTGPRQAGKTRLLRETFPNLEYVSLDLPALAQEAEHSGEGFLSRFSGPVIIDEVQYAPGLFRYLKARVDERRSQPGQYLLTGSQKFELMHGITESLAGRVGILELQTLSLAELENWSGETATGDQLLTWIWTGGYPELHAAGLPPERFYGDYVATYLERDVRQLLNVRNLRDFDRFMRLLAARTGQLLSLNAVATDIGISPNTAKGWLSVLEASNIVCLVEPYYRNLGKRLVKTPKLYFLDTGLAAYLAGFRTPTDLRDSQLLGAFFETAVLGQLFRHHAHDGHRMNAYFYRDHVGHEVDFVIPVGERLRLIECKWSETPSALQAGFQEIIRLGGPDIAVSRTIISPRRGLRRLENGVMVDDCVAFASLALQDVAAK